jgi:copper chaperone CopZ
MGVSDARGLCQAPPEERPAFARDKRAGELPGVALEAGMKEHTFVTPTAFCPHCRFTIEQAVGNLPGVDSVVVDLSEHKVTVRYDDAQLEDVAIRQRIEGAGFPVVA